jgi:hypothetical protein
MNFLEEATKITEAYCVRNRIPTRRQFTDAELAGPAAQVDEAAALTQQMADAFSAGRRVARLDLASHLNPYPVGTPAHAEWFRGWQIENAERVGRAA